MGRAAQWSKPWGVFLGGPEQIGVDKTSIHNWETNFSKPSIEYMPAIIQFLGYNPVPPPQGWADRLVQGRTALGLTQKESAIRIGVDPSTLARWERGEREPGGLFAARATTFLRHVEEFCVPDACRTA